jgi:hypothetical protein
VGHQEHLLLVLSAQQRVARLEATALLVAVAVELVVVVLAGILTFQAVTAVGLMRVLPVVVAVGLLVVKGVFYLPKMATLAHASLSLQLGLPLHLRRGYWVGQQETSGHQR